MESQMGKMGNEMEAVFLFEYRDDFCKQKNF